MYEIWKKIDEKRSTRKRKKPQKSLRQKERRNLQVKIFEFSLNFHWDFSLFPPKLTPAVVADEDDESSTTQDPKSFTFDPSENSLATGRPGRLDFVFGLDHYFGSSWHQNFMKLRVVDCRVERQGKGAELSDHFPVVVNIRPDEE